MKKPIILAACFLLCVSFAGADNVTWDDVENELYKLVLEFVKESPSGTPYAHDFFKLYIVSTIGIQCKIANIPPTTQYCYITIDNIPFAYKDLVEELSKKLTSVYGEADTINFETGIFGKRVDNYPKDYNYRRTNPAVWYYDASIRYFTTNYMIEFGIDKNELPEY